MAAIHLPEMCRSKNVETADDLHLPIFWSKEDPHLRAFPLSRFVDDPHLQITNRSIIDILFQPQFSWCTFIVFSHLTVLDQLFSIIIFNSHKYDANS